MSKADGVEPLSFFLVNGSTVYTRIPKITNMQMTNSFVLAGIVLYLTA